MTDNGGMYPYRARVVISRSNDALLMPQGMKQCAPCGLPHLPGSMARSGSDPMELRPPHPSEMSKRHSRRTYNQCEYRSRLRGISGEAHGMMTGRSVNDLVTGRLGSRSAALIQDKLPWLQEKDPLRRSVSTWVNKASTQPWAHKTSIGFYS